MFDLLKPTDYRIYTIVSSVENRQPSDSEWGPRSAARSPRRVSPARAAVLDLLKGQTEPLSQAALVEASGLHANTVREHLDGLRRRGLVRRLRAESSGRGRPASRTGGGGLKLFLARGPSGGRSAPPAASLPSVAVRVRPGSECRSDLG